MKILVTGIAGFIGSRLAEGLLRHGYTVSGIDNLSTGRADNVPPGVAFTLGDIRTDDMGSGYDVIYHCAASYKDRDAWERDASTNVGGTIEVIRLAERSHAKLVYFQTALCYGPHPVNPVTLDAPLDPHGSYAVSKTAGETYIRDSGLPYVSFRLANVYGPRNLSGPIPTFYKRLTEGLPVTVMDARRDFVYIDDLVWLAVNAAKVGTGVYHVSSGSDRSIAELYAGVRAAMGRPAEEAAVIPRGPDDVATILLDPSRTFADWGWTAQTPLADGLRAAVAWYNGHGVTETFTHLRQVDR